MKTELSATVTEELAQEEAELRRVNANVADSGVQIKHRKRKLDKYTEVQKGSTNFLRLFSDCDAWPIAEFVKDKHKEDYGF